MICARATSRDPSSGGCYVSVDEFQMTSNVPDNLDWSWNLHYGMDITLPKLHVVCAIIKSELYNNHVTSPL